MLLKIVKYIFDIYFCDKFYAIGNYLLKQDH